METHPNRQLPLRLVNFRCFFAAKLHEAVYFLHHFLLTFLRGMSETYTPISLKKCIKTASKKIVFLHYFYAISVVQCITTEPRMGGMDETSRLEPIIYIYIGYGFHSYPPSAAHCMGGEGGAGTP